MTRTEVITAVRDYLNRPDIPDSTVTVWLNVVDGEINRALVHHPRMARRSTFLAAAGDTQIPIPLALLQIIELRVGDVMWHQYAPGARDRAVETPNSYITNGACIDLFPACTVDTLFTMDYASAIEPLSETVPTNWVSSYAPDVYLYGALRESAIYLKDDARLSTWDALFHQYLDRVAGSGWASNYSSAPSISYK